MQQQLSQAGTSKDKNNPGLDFLLQQHLNQAQASGSKDKNSAGLDFLLQQQLALGSKDKQLQPNLDFLLQLGKDGKGLPGWDALSMSQMQMGGQPPSSSKGFPNFEALALAQLQLAHSMKDSGKGPSFDSLAAQAQLSPNLKGMPNFESLQHLNKSQKESKGFHPSLDALAGLQMAVNKDAKFANFGAFDLLQGAAGKDASKLLAGLDPFTAMQFAGKDPKNFVNYENMGKDKGLPPLPNFEALALAQLQLSSQGLKDKNFSNLSGLEAFAKLQQANPKDKPPGFESLQLLQSQMEALSKAHEWDQHDKDKK